MVSDRKLRANRRNAKLSTGPKNTRQTRYNARKHGLLSQASIIQDGDAKEDPAELESLREALREDLEPVGAMEEILVDRIASCIWRLRRAQRAEVGEIRLGSDSAAMNAENAIADRFDLALQGEKLSPVPGDDGYGGGGSYGGLSRTTYGIACIQNALERTRSEVEKKGFLTEDRLAVVTMMCGVREGSLAFALSATSSIARRGLKEKDDGAPGSRHVTVSPEQCKEILLGIIDDEIARLEDEADLLAKSEKLEWDAAVLARHLPSGEASDKILRYETAIDRQMFRALKGLRELQASRRARSTHLGTSDDGV